MEMVLREDFTLPVGCDFYTVREMGRKAIPERCNERFVVRFGQAVGDVKRDYRNLLAQVQAEAIIRGYKMDIAASGYSQFRKLWGQIPFRGGVQGFDKRAALYCDIFVAAILACPVTEENIYI